jgi:S-adenosylmethionine synthetase
MSYYFTSESVSEGHPDKVADAVSDGVLDAILRKDPDARVACETFVTTGLVLVGGEITTKAYVDIQDIARKTIQEIGYNKADYRFDSESCSVLNAIHSQSPDIALGVNKGGAGDQGMVFGYANNQTDVLMPLPIVLAHKLVKRLTDLRKANDSVVNYLRPDAKSQVTIEFSDDNKPIRVDAVVISSQHDADVSQKKIKEDVIEYVIKEIIPGELLDKKTKYYVNPTGRFEIGGPHGDSGLTGRKIIVDTYGGWAPHGGGAFSGKDPSKVDRSAAYAARHLAKNVVAAKLASECLVQISYAIGVAEPISVYINTNGSGVLPDYEISRILQKEVDLTPNRIIERLKLKRPIYSKTSSYGHFGRAEKEFTWENLDLVKALKKFA